jgi:hypothetical protein
VACPTHYEKKFSITPLRRQKLGNRLPIVLSAPNNQLNFNVFLIIFSAGTVLA